MVDRTATPSAPVIEYLSEEAPGELARLRSIDALIASWSDGGAAIPTRRLPVWNEPEQVRTRCRAC